MNPLSRSLLQPFLIQRMSSLFYLIAFDMRLSTPVLWQEQPPVPGREVQAVENEVDLFIAEVPGKRQPRKT